MSNNKAKRFNKGKVDLSLLPEVAAYEECKVWMHGEAKYGRDNWKKLWGDATIQVAAASALRHLMSLSNGELYDKESGLPNAAHVRCNMAMILEHMAQENMITPKIYKVPAEETVEVEYVEYRTFYGGGEIGHLEKKQINKTDLEAFKKNHPGCRVLTQDISTKQAGTFYVGGKL